MQMHPFFAWDMAVFHVSITTDSNQNSGDGITLRLTQYAVLLRQ
jgi:hypothetical protein